jgi:adenylate cyclase
MASSQPQPVSPWSLQPVVDWLFSEGRLIERDDAFLLELAHRLRAAGAPIERLVVSLLTLNPEFMAVTCTWLASTDRVRRFETERRIRETDRYIGSPMQQLYDTRKRVRQNLTDLPEDAHSAYVELAEDGFTDYLALPILFAGGLGASMILSTRARAGFSEHDIENFRRLRDYCTPSFEVHALKHLSRSVLNTYVGRRTGEKVLEGMIKRGDADVIHAAIWFSDLRDFTRLTETLPAADLLEMLNDYFEFVSAAVTARGGEILRFIGDAMLIVFPIDENMCGKTAANAALDSALDARNTLATLNHRRRRHGKPAIEFGVGLNIGEVIYGNVGAPDRLDFTVMGPAVNRSARLESLTKTLGASILFSKKFADLIDQPVKAMGEHEMRGIEGAQAVFALDESG